MWQPKLGEAWTREICVWTKQAIFNRIARVEATFGTCRGCRHATRAIVGDVHGDVQEASCTRWSRETSAVLIADTNIIVAYRFALTRLHEIFRRPGPLP